MNKNKNILNDSSLVTEAGVGHGRILNKIILNTHSVIGERSEQDANQRFQCLVNPIRAHSG